MKEVLRYLGNGGGRRITEHQANIMVDAVVKAAEKFGHGVDVAFGSRVNLKHVQQCSMLPEGGIEENNDTRISGAGNCHLTYSLHGRLLVLCPEEEQESREKEDDVDFEASGDGEYEHSL